MKKLEWVGEKCGIVTPEEGPGCPPEEDLEELDYQVGDREPCVMCDKPGCWAVVRLAKNVKN